MTTFKLAGETYSPESPEIERRLKLFLWQCEQGRRPTLHPTLRQAMKGHAYTLEQHAEALKAGGTCDARDSDDDATKARRRKMRADALSMTHANTSTRN